ncbi:MAG: Fe-S-containing hydro-lyase [Negativicutes bacterium]|nr:Fe-S-containing hydro-lyase [Negativicutes bacterium]
MQRITLPLTDEIIRTLRAGDEVLLTGWIYTARDAAHQRLFSAWQSGGALPIDLQNQTIYYAGPAPTPPGHIIGSIGPTTSGRMDPYTPALLAAGLKGMIGKGKRSQVVIDAMRKYGAVYFAALGGAAALQAKTVRQVEVVAYEDLATEAIRRLFVEEMPVIVAVDTAGVSVYQE